MSRLAHWVNHHLHQWWPLIATTTAAFVILSMTVVVLAATDGRADEKARAERSEAQSEQLARIIEEQERTAEIGAEEAGKAVAEVRAIMLEMFAAHDHNIAVKLNNVLAQIAELHDTEPVYLPVPSPTPTRAPSSSPTTTNPKCAKRADHPQC